MERRISYWPADVSEPLVESTLPELLRERAADSPERVAVVEGVPDPAARRRWTYRELLESAETVARALLAQFAPGERIAVWSASSAEWMLLQHGAAMAGLVLVTVNPAYLADELAHVLGTARVAGLFHAERYRATDMRAVVDAVRPRIDSLRRVVSFADWEAFVATSDPRTALPVVAPLDMAQIQFTSGTTGKPKGACLHHRGLYNAARFGARRAGFPPGGVWGSAMPMFHIGGSSSGPFGAFTARGTLVMQPQFDAAVMLELIETERINHLHAVPTMLLALLEHPDRLRRDLSSLGIVMSGGSTIPAALVARVCAEFGCRFTITFGQTESHGVLAQSYPEDPPELQASTIGRPGPQVELKIADPESGAPRPLGEPGEIWARGYQTMLGYFATSDQALTADGWLRTGDSATMDAQGYLRIAGRLKDMIIRGGENIYPREIEDVLAAHPAIELSSVVGVPDPKWGEAVAAVIRLRPGAPRPASAELEAYCRARLAAYKTPVQWYFATEVPMTLSGKVQKFALREAIVAGRLAPAAT